MKTILRIHSVVVALFVHMSIGAVGTNRLQKVELHSGAQEQTTDELRQLEVAKLICYFKDKPLLQHLQTVRKEDGWEYQTYLLMHAECDAPAQKALHDIAQAKHSDFYIATEQVQQPMMGVKLEIGYNPQKLSLNYDAFNAITRQPGLLFRLINRPLLERLASQERPLLQLAHRTVSKQAKVGIDCGHGGRMSTTLLSSSILGIVLGNNLQLGTDAMDRICKKELSRGSSPEIITHRLLVPTTTFGQGAAFFDCQKWFTTLGKSRQGAAATSAAIRVPSLIAPSSVRSKQKQCLLL